MIKLGYKFFALLAIIILIILRFYNIQNSLFFWNDMGRDLSVLQFWQSSGKPPLLGPQTSALPINQSAIYFYLLYPGFLLSQGHPIANLITLAFVYISIFIFSISLFKKSKLSLLVIFFLVAIHPQYIIQGRFVWNPSFVTPFIILAFYSFFYKKYWLFSLSIAIAVSLSYSIAPLLIAFAIYWIIFDRQNLKTIALWLFGSFVLFNLPTIFFELRHNFLLTTSLFTKQAPVQQSITFMDKTLKLSDFIFFTDSSSLNLCLFVLMITTCLITLIKYRRSTKSIQFLSAFLLINLLLITYLTPITIQPHYIFGFTSLLFILIASQSSVRITFLLFVASILYLNQSKFNFYFRPAPRSYQQINQCFKNYCFNFKDSTYVSVESSYHPFHNGPEHQYLMKKNGCNVLDINSQNGQSKFMTVIVDMGNFSDQTKYYELDLFGKFKTVSSLQCLPNFQVLTLEKI